MRTTAYLAVLCASTGFMCERALAQDPVKVAPNAYRTLLENEHVRVCELHVRPSEKVAMHRHPDHVVYVLSPGKMRLTYPDGSTKDLENKPGEVKWIKAEGHAGENVGGSEFRAIVVELRGPIEKAGKGTHGTAAKEDPALLSADAYKVIFDNEWLRILETSVKEGAKIPVHSHPPHVVYVISGGGKIKATTPDGKTIETDLVTGQTLWSDAVEHSIENVGKDSRVLHFEIKQSGRGE